MAQDSLTGKTIGRYQIEERLGQGGMAEVYKGYQSALDRHVAIKVMHSFLSVEGDFLQRFKREARAMAALSHPNIVRVYDFDVYGESSYYLVMEYIDGGTLKQTLENLIEAGQTLPLPQSVQMMADVADALAYAHGRGMVHRDIKPANIMLRQDTGQAILTDFGIVKLMGDQSMAYTATGAMIGTPIYMSPEQAMGQTGDERVDIYSLGVMLFQMVTNQLPFAADTPLGVAMKHVTEPVPMPTRFNPDVPLDLQYIIVKAMAKKPEERFQTAAEMAAALRTINWGVKGNPTAVAASAAPVMPSPTFVWTPTTAVATETGTAVQATVVNDSTPTAAGQTAVSGMDATLATTETKSRPVWWYVVGGLLLLLLVIGGIVISGVLGDDEPGGTAVAGLGDGTATAVVTETATAVAATDEPNVAATQLAELSLALTAEAQNTETPTVTSTATPTSTPSPTTDATALFLETCTKEVELVSVLRNNAESNVVAPNAPFTVSWVLENKGSCPWTEELLWGYVAGEQFAYDDEPIVLDTAVAAGETITLTAQFVAPSRAGLYESRWQLGDEEGDAFGPEIPFAFQVMLPQTATRAMSPTPSATPTAVATATSETQGRAAYAFSVESCDYPGDGPDWRCQVTIYPYLDGNNSTPGNFTVFIFDQPNGQAAEYRGAGPFTHFVQGRRCADYNNEIRVIEDRTQTDVSGQLYINPNDHFAGGCVQ